MNSNSKHILEKQCLLPEPVKSDSTHCGDCFQALYIYSSEKKTLSMNY